MRAAVFESYGPPGVLHVTELPDPVPGPGEVLVRVRAAGVQPFDVAVRGGRMPSVRASFPQQIGQEYAGVVEAVGAGVTGLTAGDPVLGSTMLNGAAELVVVPAGNVVRKPAELDFPDWQIKQVDRSDYKDIMDVHFSHVGQCDPGDCDAQREFFDVVDAADQQDAWKYKYLLDIDGNAFSGRFYAFLQSHSLTFKMAVFREWHEEWIKPWVHYIPLSLSGHEYVEVMRYFDSEAEGRKLISQVAENGREWAAKAIRNADMEVWFFRLLLEYGRLIDDNREHMGFTMA